MAMPKKELIYNKTLDILRGRYREGVPMAALHRTYIAQGEDYLVSLPVFMKLLKEIEDDNSNKTV